MTSIKKWLSNNYFYESPDLVVLLMRDIAIERYIYSLESYIFDNKKDNEISDSVIAIGYPYKDPKIFTSTILPTYYSGIIADSSNIDPFYPSNDSIYYTIQLQTIQGISRAPVFFRYHPKGKKNKRNHMLFGGVLFGGNVDYGNAYVVNPELVKLKIKQYHQQLGKKKLIH